MSNLTDLDQDQYEKFRNIVFWAATKTYAILIMRMLHNIDGNTVEPRHCPTLRNIGNDGRVTISIQLFEKELVFVISKAGKLSLQTLVKKGYGWVLGYQHFNIHLLPPKMIWNFGKEQKTQVIGMAILDAGVTIRQNQSIGKDTWDMHDADFNKLCNEAVEQYIEKEINKHKDQLFVSKQWERERFFVEVCKLLTVKLQSDHKIERSITPHKKKPVYLPEAEWMAFLNRLDRTQTNDERLYSIQLIQQINNMNPQELEEMLATINEQDALA